MDPPLVDIINYMVASVNYLADPDSGDRIKDMLDHANAEGWLAEGDVSPLRW